MLALKEAIRSASLRLKVRIDARDILTRDEQLAETLRLLRAAERNDHSLVLQCALRYPYLQQWVRMHSPQPARFLQHVKIRDHAMELARISTTEQIESLKKLKDTLPEFEFQKRKDNFLGSLKRMVPGAQTSLGAVKTSSGLVTADPAEMANALAEHWGKVFSKKDINKDKLDKWLALYGYRFAADPSEYELTEQQIREAIEQGN